MLTFSNNYKYKIILEGTFNSAIKECDVTGAIFAWTNDLLEGKMSISRLQSKNHVGKIGITTAPLGALKTKLSIEVPYNGGRDEASVLAATLALLPKIGVGEGQFNSVKIITSKKDLSYQILTKAKQIYDTAFTGDETYCDPLQKLREVVSQKPVITMGNLTLGGAFRSSASVIVVEGRKDVLQLAKAKIYNTIGVGGLNFEPEQLAIHVEGKSLTVMVDGNKGGKAVFDKLEARFKGQITHVVNLQEGLDVQDLQPDRLRQVLQEKKPYKER